MTPKELSVALNRIASKIDDSTNPSRDLVLADVNRILASMEVEAGSHEAASLKSMGKNALLALMTTLGIKGGIEVGKASAELDNQTKARVQRTSDALYELDKAAKANPNEYRSFTLELENAFRDMGLPTRLTVVPDSMTPEQVQKLSRAYPGGYPASACISNGGEVVADKSKGVVHFYPDKDHTKVVDVDLNTFEVLGQSRGTTSDEK